MKPWAAFILLGMEFLNQAARSLFLLLSRRYNELLQLATGALRARKQQEHSSASLMALLYHGRFEEKSWGCHDEKTKRPTAKGGKESNDWGILVTPSSFYFLIKVEIIEPLPLVGDCWAGPSVTVAVPEPHFLLRVFHL